MALILGYLEQSIIRKPRLVNDEEARFYKQMLNGRLFASIKNKLFL
jgi:hypothetical protein